MSQLLYGSINYDALIKELKTGKVKTFKSDAGIRLVNINVWVNDEPDQFDNDASIQLQLTEQYKDEKKPYIGNLRKYVPKTKDVSSSSLVDDDDDDLGF